MTTTATPGTAAVHGRLWGTRARDWANLQEGQHRADYDALLTRLCVGVETVLCDVGCASGFAARMAADRGARVSGLDAAEKLIEIARERVPGGDFRTGEMEALPFPDGMFDAVTGFNAFNYAARPAVALAEARRIAKPGGRIAMTAWGKPEGMGVASLINVLIPLLPPRPPDAPGIFALSDDRTLRSLVESAGLEVLDVEEVADAWWYPDLATALRAFASSGRAVRAIECTSEATVDAAHASALAPFRCDDGSYRVGSSTMRLVART